jgi:hypothetical protein
MGTLVFQATLGGAVNIIGPNIAGTVNFTLPSADGSNGQFLKTNGSGVLSFATATTAPGGSTTQVQYNNAGAFAGSANFTYDGAGVLTVGNDSVATVFNSVGDVAQYVVDSNGTGSTASHQWKYGSTEAMRLNATGLGIGTSSPQLKFVVSNGGAQGFEVNPNSGIISGGIDILCYNRSAGAYKPIFTNAEYHVWATSTTERARIDTSGNLLVGTTSFTSSTTVSNGIFGGNFRSIRSNATIPASSTATVMTLSSSVTGVYIVNANFGATGNAIYGGMLIVVANSGSFRIVTNGGGSSSALSMSGANVQITNALGSPLDAVASAVFIGN